MSQKQDTNDPYNFTGQLDEASWDLLKQHHERGAVFLLDESLDLVEVATAIAKDSFELVKGWLDAKKLRPLSSQEVENWEKMPNEKVVKFLIVQPYVIIKKILKN